MMDETLKREEDESADRFLKKAKRIVIELYNTLPENEEKDILVQDDVYIVWFSKTLQNWKALLSTTREDGLYYELTFNGDRLETYVDMYKKVLNITVSDIIGHKNN